jgi:hypothetical protein
MAEDNSIVGDSGGSHGKVQRWRRGSVGTSGGCRWEDAAPPYGAQHRRGGGPWCLSRYGQCGEIGDWLAGFSLCGIDRELMYIWDIANY